MNILSHECVWRGGQVRVLYCNTGTMFSDKFIYGEMIYGNVSEQEATPQTKQRRNQKNDKQHTYNIKR